MTLIDRGDLTEDTATGKFTLNPFVVKRVNLPFVDLATDPDNPDYIGPDQFIYRADDAGGAIPSVPLPLGTFFTETVRAAAYGVKGEAGSLDQTAFMTRALWQCARVMAFTGRGVTLVLPPGRIALFDTAASPWTFSQSLRIVGDDAGTTIEQRTAGKGCMSLNFSGYDGKSIPKLTIEGVRFEARAVCGEAISAVWPKPAGRALCHARLTDIEVAASGYGDPGSFSKAIHLKNAGGAYLTRINVTQLGLGCQDGIHLDYDLDAYAYSIACNDINVHGSQNAVRITGWAENLRLTGGELVAQRAFVFDATGVAYRMPVVLLHGVHFNGANEAISIKRARAVAIRGCDVFVDKVSDTTLADITAISIEDAEMVTVDAHVNCGPGSPTSSVALLRMNNVQQFDIRGQYEVKTMTSGLSRAVDLVDCSDGQISGRFKAKGAKGNTGIHMTGCSDVQVINPRVANFSTGIKRGGATVSGAVYSNCTTNEAA
jgi:hypothetical protein